MESLQIKNTIPEMKYRVGRVTADWVLLKEKSVNLKTQQRNYQNKTTERQKCTTEKNKQSFSDPWDNTKHLVYL